MMHDRSIKRPAVRYHGGKWLLAPWIISHFPEHRIYTEVFGGGASVLLRKPRSFAEVYNDLDGEIVNVFKVLRDRGDALRRALELTPFSRAEYEESLLPVEDPVEQARRTIMRSFMGFGSAAISGEKTGFRANSNRSNTTPAHDWRNYPGVLPAMIERLRGVVIEHRDGLDVLRQQDQPDALHYVDPPYVHDTRTPKYPGARRQSYRHEMTDEQHRELAAVLLGLKGSVILSGYPCAMYDELFADWQRVDRFALADGARRRTESLWLSPGVKLKQHNLLDDRMEVANA